MAYRGMARLGWPPLPLHPSRSDNPARRAFRRYGRGPRSRNQNETHTQSVRCSPATKCEMTDTPRKIYIQLKLTECQQAQIRMVTGREVTSLELRLHRLPEPAEPLMRDGESIDP